jgi:uncharacterized membrane protein (UPF0127 family)
MAGYVKVTIEDKEWLASLASNYRELVQGLGDLPAMDSGVGMLFDLGFEQHVTVTTEAMLFPLDIALLNEELLITEVYRDVQPGYLVHSTFPARYFLEVNAGELDNIVKGDRVSVEVMAPAQTTVPDWAASLLGLVGALGMSVLAVSIVKSVAERSLEEPGLVSRFFIGQSGKGALK